MCKAIASNRLGFAKYMVLMWNGREQVLVFPFGVKHAEVLEYIQAENPNVGAVSAGLYFNERDTFWSGGRSNSLNLKSRPKDRQLLQSFFNSPSRRLWDLTIMAEEAEMASRCKMGDEAGKPRRCIS